MRPLTVRCCDRQRYMKSSAVENPQEIEFPSERCRGTSRTSHRNGSAVKHSRPDLVTVPFLDLVVQLQPRPLANLVHSPTLNRRRFVRLHSGNSDWLRLCFDKVG
jgi:hypothetical protein